MKKKSEKKKSLFRVCILMFFALCIGVTMQAQTSVSGKVFDSQGEPLIGVSVSVKGTTTGTMTDITGNYNIKMPDGKLVLVFSFLGYKTQELNVGRRLTLDVTMEDDTQVLGEVVVVGYNTVKRESLTGALQTVKSDKLLDTTTPVVENMLSGKAPGVYVNSGSGRPGEVGKIIIRGKSTINGSTDPLWVIDGVIMGSSATDINPADIESLTVLKDAASTAVYGSQGANGVILVTTKKGTSGKARIGVSAKFVSTRLDKGRFDVMNGSELYDLYNSFSNPEAFEKNWWWKPELKDKNFNWWDNATQNGFAQDYNISISGGNEKLRTYTSIGVYDETGAIKGYDYTRYNALLKVEYKVTDRLTIKPQISGSRRDTYDNQHSTTAMYGNLPWDSPYKDDGTLVGNAPNPTWVNTTGSNYLYDLQWNYTKGEVYELRGSFDFDYKITDWLTFASVNNYKFGQNNSTEYVDPRSSGGLAAGGRVTEDMVSHNRLYTNHMLRFNKAFDKHFVSAVAGYEWNEYNSKSSQSMSTSLAPGFEVGSVAAKAEKATSWRSAWAVQSYISNINYSYDDKYLAQISLRRDGASNFGKNTRYGTFYSVSGGWNIHNEDFFKKVDFVNKLKLRASYGSVGNRPTALYPHFGLYALASGSGVSAKPISYDGQPGAIISQIGNPNLAWEKSYTMGVGLDATLLDRVNITLDYYSKNTSDLLYEVPLPGVIGVSSIWRNEGELENKGFEATVSVDVLKNKDWMWTVEANIGLNRNKVTKLYGQRKEMIVGDGSGIAGSASKLITPGKDADTWYLPEWAGVDPQSGAPTWYKTDTQGNRVITDKYREANQVALSKYTPDFFGGFSTNLSYKSFDLSAVFSYSVGGEIYNYARAEYDSDGAYTDRNQMKLHSGWNRWEKQGDIATHPLPSYNNKTNSNKVSSRFLETGTYLKMRNLTIGYNVACKALKVSNLRLFVSGENLFTITHFSGVDPEIPPRNGRITGVATSVYPQTKKFVLGVSVTL